MQQFKKSQVVLQKVLPTRVDALKMVDRVRAEIQQNQQEDFGIQHVYYPNKRVKVFCTSIESPGYKWLLNQGFKQKKEQKLERQRQVAIQCKINVNPSISPKISPKVSYKQKSYNSVDNREGDDSNNEIQEEKEQFRKEEEMEKEEYGNKQQAFQYNKIMPPSQSNDSENNNKAQESQWEKDFDNQIINKIRSGDTIEQIFLELNNQQNNSKELLHFLSKVKEFENFQQYFERFVLKKQNGSSSNNNNPHNDNIFSSFESPYSTLTSSSAALEPIQRVIHEDNHQNIRQTEDSNNRQNFQIQQVKQRKQQNRKSSSMKQRQIFVNQTIKKFSQNTKSPKRNYNNSSNTSNLNPNLNLRFENHAFEKLFEANQQKFQQQGDQNQYVQQELNKTLQKSANKNSNKGYYRKKEKQQKVEEVEVNG